VGAALFGDGAAAMILGTDPLPVTETPCFELDWAGQCYLPGTETTIEGNLTEEGIIFKLGRELPKIIEANVQPFCDPIIKRVAGNLQYNDLFWAVHPGKLRPSSNNLNFILICLPFLVNTRAS
jgi:predicted naringenin-chalcone synthase